MLFKTRKLEEQWYYAAPESKLRKLVDWVNDYHYQMFSFPITITNVFEDARTTKTHSEGRAVDIRTRDKDKHLIKDFCEGVNRSWDTRTKFPSGKTMQVAVYHDVGLGKHIHLQIPRGEGLVKL